MNYLRETAETGFEHSGTYWRLYSKGKPARPRISPEHIKFIRRISAENPTWGEDKIALELKLKLGIEHSTSTIRKYMVETGPVSSSTWRTFLQNHLSEIYAIDFKTQILTKIGSTLVIFGDTDDVIRTARLS